MRFTFAHNNFNVKDLAASLAFYQKALGLTESRRIERGDFTIVYLSDGASSHLLELTWLKNWPKPAYDLGDNEFHLALRADNFEEAHKLHEQMGCIAMDNPDMGIYFITDPDDYWIEILPAR